MRRLAWSLVAAAIACSTVQAAPLAPAAVREANAVTRTGALSLKVAVPASAAYVGAKRFILRDVADAEIHVFVDAGADRKVRRIYWIQFEEFLPTNAHEYSYADGNERRRIDGMDFWVSARRMAADGASPGSDRAAVVELIKAVGYTLPDQIIRARFLHLPDDRAGTGKGRRELMLIYAEDVEPSGLAADANPTDAAPSADWPAAAKALIDRGAAAMGVTTF